MTIEADESFECAVCRTRSTHPVLMSSSVFGSSDLDMRPGEMIRSALHIQVQRCPECGFCHDSISDQVDGSAEEVRSARYREVLDDKSRSELARRFLCQALIDQQARQWADAAWASIHAAWAFDDVDDLASADQARRQAVALMDEAARHDQLGVDEATSHAALRVDLLRRTGRFDEALETISRTETSDNDQTVAVVLRYQSALIAQRDTAPHKIEDANPASPGRHHNLGN
jgi:hypothetical protein